MNRNRLVRNMLLLMLLLILGTMFGLGMGVFIAGRTNRLPTVTFINTDSPPQLTETATAFVDQFKATFYAKVTEKALTLTPVATK